ncbi:MAG: septation protein A [Pseudomonadales bacterium]|nr:septation protein A [Pseudomonadales bacterium]MCP5214109.1 septation protein A [Pseudomonadales bacterium]MCP5303425.1 septation protein A [Pseudomonadales bacterium]
MKKLLFDFFPIAIFFAIYKYTNDIVTATAILIPATVFQVIYAYWRTRKIEKMYLVTLFLVVTLGGATVILQDKVFIQWKPTVVNWLFAVAFLVSEFIGSKNILERMMGGQLELPKSIWSKLNYLWIGFFLLSGLVNIYVAFSGHFTEEQWVNFKLFGMLGLTIVFVVLQGLYLSRHLSEGQIEQISTKKENEE